LWAKDLNAKDNHKEMFPVNSGKSLSRKAVHSWVEKFSQGLSKVSDDETEMRKWLRQLSKHFYAAGYDGLVKRWDKCIVTCLRHAAIVEAQKSVNTLRNNRGNGTYSVPSRTALHHARFQGNSVVNTVTTQQYSL
jgi:hypothetical protein